MYILLSDTPVAGTVPRLAHWIERLTGVQTHALVRRNYAHNAFRLPGGAFGCLPDWRSYVTGYVKKASCIFVHNVFSSDLLDLVFSTKPQSCRVFYQYHSPPLEPPAFLYGALNQYAFDHVFAVAQGYGRFIPGSTLVPNVVPDMPAAPTVPKSNILFVPHMRSTNDRWSMKFSPRDEAFLKENASLYPDYVIRTVKSAFGRDVVTHEEVTFYLQACIGVADDVHTGLFHQTSLEGLKAGCAVFCGADLCSIEEFCAAADAEPPPFVSVNDISEVVRFLSAKGSLRLLTEIGQASRNYADTYLAEERLAHAYCARIRDFTA